MLSFTNRNHVTRKSKSPLKARPLRNPGQSVEDQLHDYLYDRLLTPFIIAIFLVLLASIEWVRYYQELPPAPVLHSVIAAVAILYCGFKMSRAWPDIKQLRLGRDGEKVVGQYLERLRSKGYQVFHDVKGEGFNVDHVLIGPAGIFSIETKTFSKPQRGEAKIAFDGKTMLANGFLLDRDPIVQAKAQATWLREVISESMGKSFAVRPVILFPGWFVEQHSGSTKEIWVLEPKALPAFLEQEKRTLLDEEISQASFHLSRVIRTTK